MALRGRMELGCSHSSTETAPPLLLLQNGQSPDNVSSCLAMGRPAGAESGCGVAQVVCDGPTEHSLASFDGPASPGGHSPAARGFVDSITPGWGQDRGQDSGKTSCGGESSKMHTSER